VAPLALWRFARAHLRDAFPHLGGQSQLNRRVRALQSELRALQAALAAGLGAGAPTPSWGCGTSPTC
jgi:plasmid stabilization system protein ParE